jgi:hypoxanthine phosphoribosyltransferase
MASEHTVLFSAEMISVTVRDLAASIDRDLGDSRLVVIIVLKGAVMFSCDLVRAMETETEMVFLSASSYSDGFTPGETLRLQQDIELDVSGRDVLIVDDIIDTGRTLTGLGQAR